MSDDTAQSLETSLVGLEGLTHWIKFVTDQKAIAMRLDELVGMTRRAIEARAEAERAQGSLAGAKAEIDAAQAALDEREAEIATLNDRWRERNAALDAREAAVSEAGQLAEMRQIKRDVEGQETWLRSQLMLISGLNTRYQGVLQGLPCFADVVAEIMHDAKSAEPEPTFEGGLDGGNIPVENLVTGSTLTRSVRHRAERRVEG